MSAHLTGMDMPFLPELADPVDRRARNNAKAAGSCLTAHTFVLNRPDNPLPKIQ